MLRIGYIRLNDDLSGDYSSRLKEHGCDVVRVEDAAAYGGAPMLEAILEFIGSDDQLVVGAIEDLGTGPQAMLSVLERLEARGASLTVAEPGFSTEGPAGDVLRAVLQALSANEPASQRRRGPARTEDIHALHAAGIGPVEIARRLGVSRMTVWRKLKAMAN